MSGRSEDKGKGEGKGVSALRKQIDAPVAAFFSSCVHCGLCAEACLFYVETGDPDLTPIRKVEPMRRLWRDEHTLLGRLASRLGLTKPVTDADLKDWETLVYDSCTMCGRCSLVCPVGNDITAMVRKMREGMSAAGCVPPELTQAAGRHLDQGSPMGDLLPALKAQVAHAVKETGIDISFDEPGAEYLAVFSAQEVAVYPDVIGAMARLFKQAGKSWTISTAAFEASNVGVQIGNADLARTLVSRVVEAAETLGVKAVIAPECGHAYQALRWDGPNLIGRPYGFEVVHIIQLLERWAREGRIRTKRDLSGRTTLHDPCQVGRRGGIVNEPRSLLNGIAQDFVEMKDAGLWNWCCSGGGGVGANPRADGVRKAAFGRKKKQIEETEAEQVVTLCAYCHHTLEESLDENDMALEVLSLTELVAEYLEED